MLQGFLDWLSGWPVGSAGDLAYAEANSLFRFWGNSYLRLLTEYAHAIEMMPGAIHEIDPAIIFPSRDHGILDQLETSGTFNRLVVLTQVDTFTETSSVPAHRCLPRNTGQSERLHLIIDKTRGIVITIDRLPGTMPKLYCQDQKTGRRRQAVVDVEFTDNLYELETIAAKLSPDSRNLAVVHLRRGGDNMLYTTVWQILDHVGFDEKSITASWARKIISTSKRTSAGTFGSSQVIAFDGAGCVHSPNGRINLRTGCEQPLPFNRIKDVNYSTAYLSDDGATMMHLSSPTTLSFALSTGEVERVDFDNGAERVFPYGLSVTGRYGIWKEVHGRQTVSYMYDTLLHTKTKLDVEIPASVLHFSRDNKLLYAVIQNQDLHKRFFITVSVWAIQDSNLKRCTSKDIRTDYLASQFDDDDQVVHLVGAGRIWNRLHFTGGELREIEPAAPLQIYKRVEHCVSLDGARLAVVHLGLKQYVTFAFLLDLCPNPLRLEVQMIELVQCGNKIFQHTLTPSVEDFESALVIFSPNLELIFVGNRIFQTHITNEAEPLLLPLPWLNQEKRDQRTLVWTCGFSPCMQYFAAVANREQGSGETLQLHIFKIHMGDRYFQRCEVDNLSLTRYDGLGFAFHPRLSILLLCGWVEEGEDDDLPRLEFHLLNHASTSFTIVGSTDSSMYKVDCMVPVLICGDWWRLLKTAKI
jgi:hypothetical protein